jgi:hypothetical protein
MMGKMSPKNLINALFFAVFTMILGACIQPINVDVFLGDEKVQEVISKDEGGIRVFLHNASDSGLTAGNTKISGLDPNKYYMIEEFNEAGAVAFTDFVGPNGKRFINLIGIGKVIGREIIELTNGKTYKVTSAAPLNGSFEYADLPAAPATTAGFTPITAAGGAISLDEPVDRNYLNLDSVFSAAGDYGIVRISGAAAAAAVTPSTAAGFIITLDNSPVSDYIFFDNNAAAGSTRLWALTVNTQAAVADVNITLTISYNAEDHTVTFDIPALGIAQDSLIFGGPVTISITNSGSIPGFTAASTVWRLGGMEYTGAVLTLNTFLPVLPKGTHVLSVEFLIGGERYSTTVDLLIS